MGRDQYFNFLVKNLFTCPSPPPKKKTSLITDIPDQRHNYFYGIFYASLKLKLYLLTEKYVFSFLGSKHVNQLTFLKGHALWTCVNVRTRCATASPSRPTPTNVKG